MPGYYVDTDVFLFKVLDMLGGQTAFEGLRVGTQFTCLLVQRYKTDARNWDMLGGETGFEGAANENNYL